MSTRFNTGLFALTLLGASAAALSQAVPPPGVDAARAPTERTLRPSGKKQNVEREFQSQDCRKAEAEMREQFRIQADGVRSQYASRIAKAEPAARGALEKEREAKIHELQAQGESAARQVGGHCREDNRELLHAPRSPVDAR